MKLTHWKKGNRKAAGRNIVWGVKRDMCGKVGGGRSKIKEERYNTRHTDNRKICL